MKRKSRSEAIQRIAALWSPLYKRLILAGARVAPRGGSTVNIVSGAGQTTALADAWAPTFAAKQLATEGRDEYLAAWPTPVVLGDTMPPDIDSYMDFLKDAIDTAPGKDGIPYGGWRAYGD